MPSTSVLSYQWTCPGGYCDAGGVDPEWAARIQQGNILVVNVRNDNDRGDYNCTVMDGTRQLGTATYMLTITGKSTIYNMQPVLYVATHVQTFHSLPVVSLLVLNHDHILFALLFYFIGSTSSHYRM